MPSSRRPDGTLGPYFSPGTPPELLEVLWEAEERGFRNGTDFGISGIAMGMIEDLVVLAQDGADYTVTYCGERGLREELFRSADLRRTREQFLELVGRRAGRQGPPRTVEG